MRAPFGTLPRQAEQVGRDALTLARRLGSPSRIAYAAIVLAMRLSELGDDSAEVVFDEAPAAGRKAEDDWVDTFAGHQLAMIRGRSGDYAGSAHAVLDSINRASAKATTRPC